MAINLTTQRLIDDGESGNIELISSPKSFEEIAKAVCAFLNGKGGTVIAGIDESVLKSAISIPIDEATDLQVKKLQQYLYEEVSPNCVMSVTRDLTEYGYVLVVDVPDGRDTPYTFDGRVFLRSGSQIKAADSQAIREMVLQKGTNVQRWERRPSPTLQFDDLDRELIDVTVKRAASKRGFEFDDSKNLQTVLQQLEVMDFGQLTNAADVLFGRRVSQRLPQTRARAVRYETDKSGDFIDDQLFEGPALSLLENLLAFVKRHIPIAGHFDYPSGGRKDVPQFPFDAVHEGIVNALVHRDYSGFSGGVKVFIFPNRLEIWNSGKLPEGLTSKKLEMAKHDSILVNPDISHIFYLHGQMERVGRGTYNIVRECRSMGVRSPEWKVANGGVQLTFFSERVNLRSEFNKRQISLLEKSPPGSEVLTIEYQDELATNVSSRQARRDLEVLEDYGFLNRLGTGRGTVFVRTEKRLPDAESV